MDATTPYDFVIVGSGFGGSISAMRLVEKGYRVLVLEQGMRFADDDFAASNWDIRRHQWLPRLRCFGIWQNTLPKNYLYFAEKWGARIQPASQVTDLRPLEPGRRDGARNELTYRRTTAVADRGGRVHARQVILSTGAINTNRLLFTWRDRSKTLPRLSTRLGTNVRTNSESLTGITRRDRNIDYSEGVAIGSIFSPDDITHMEAVRFPRGSAATLMLLGAPMVGAGLHRSQRLLRSVAHIIAHPVDFLYAKFLPGLSNRTMILLTMQTRDSLMRLRLGRHPANLFRLGLVCEHDAVKTIAADVATADRITRSLAGRTNAIPQAMVNQSLLNLPGTAHFMGGVPFGRTAAEGVIDLNCQVHHYPGLFVVDGAIIPANPGVNPSLTIAALAEYAMEKIPPNPGPAVRPALRKKSRIDA